MISILFTRRSNLICSVLQEPVSHAALSYGPYVLHSTGKGVSLEFYSDFSKKSDIIYTVKVPDAASVDFVLAVSMYLGKPYDYGAFLYLTFYFLLRKIGIRLPKVNLWQSTGMFLCTELISSVVSRKEDSMITPYQLYLKLKDTTV